MAEQSATIFVSHLDFRNNLFQKFNNEIMKKFMEEYGSIALSAVVVVLLVSFTTPVGAAAKQSVTGLVEKFTVSTNTVTDSTLDKTKESHL